MRPRYAGSKDKGCFYISSHIKSYNERFSIEFVLCSGNVHNPVFIRPDINETMLDAVEDNVEPVKSDKDEDAEVAITGGENDETELLKEDIKSKGSLREEKESIKEEKELLKVE